jgi:hypothetical protein
MATPNPSGLFETAIREIGLALQPIREIDSADALGDLFGRLGIVLPTDRLDPAWLSEMAAGVGDLADKLSVDEWDVVTGLEVADALRAIVSSASELPRKLRAALDPQVFQAIEAAIGELPKRLFDYLLATHLERNVPHVSHMLSLLGVIEQAGDEALPYVTFVWDRLPLLLTSPIDWADEAYLWRSGFAAQKFLERLGRVFRAFGFPGGIYKQLPVITAKLGHAADSNDGHYNTELRIPLVQVGTWPDPANYGLLGINLCEARSGKGPAGLAAYLYAAGAIRVDNIELSESLIGSLRASGSIGNGIGLLLEPDKRLTLMCDFLSSEQPGNAEAKITFVVQPAPKADDALTLLKLGDGAHVTARFGSLTLEAEKSATVEDICVDIAIDPIEFALGTCDGDGFLAAVLPKEPVRTPLSIGYSLSEGFRFHGGLELKRRIPLAKQLGPLFIQGIDMELTLESGGIGAAAAVSGSATIGPLTVAVERVGLEAKLDFSRPGLLGSADLDVAFLPPTGVGLSIAAGPLSGGGFLSFDKKKGEYAGAVQLQFGAVALTAVGILNTKMPGGSLIQGGYSLLVIICAKFAPIQLGMGFTLNGVGGLLGLHRTMNVDALRSGLRAGALDSILFPTDVVGRAAQLIETISTLFPVAPRRFLLAPMVRLGWGTPALLTCELGVLVELPSPVRVAVVGRIRLALPPDDERAVIVINLDTLGVILFEQGEVSIDASLYDSHIAGFPLTGDMALRARWKNAPMFALSAGGFHPAFQPPEGFPSLRRLALSVTRGDNPRLRLDAYLAITSNTVQFGGRAELYAEKAGFSVQAFMSLDTLIHLDPFGLEADLACGAAVRYGKKTICAVEFEGHLTGPAPWRVQGRARFKVLFVSYEISFNETFGAALPPPAAPENVERRVVDEVEKGANWTALPPTGVPAVSLRALPPGEKQFYVHPCGRTLMFQQRLVPLGIPLEVFGSAAIEGARCFKITSVKVGGATKETLPLREAFAPGQFFRLSDDERLSRPAFESFVSGFSFDFDGLDYDDLAADDAAELGYELVKADPARVGRVEAMPSTPVQRGSPLALSDRVLDIRVRDRSYAITRRDGDEQHAAPQLPRRFGSFTEAKAHLLAMGADRVRSFFIVEANS